MKSKNLKISQNKNYFFIATTFIWSPLIKSSIFSKISIILLKGFKILKFNKSKIIVIGNLKILLISFLKITNEVLVEEFEIDESIITDDANFRETLDLDSLDYVDLVVFVEENFKVKLTAEDFQTVVTFHDFYNLILNKINE